MKTPNKKVKAVIAAQNPEQMVSVTYEETRGSRDQMLQVAKDLRMTRRSKKNGEIVGNLSPLMRLVTAYALANLPAFRKWVGNGSEPK